MTDPRTWDDEALDEALPLAATIGRTVQTGPMSNDLVRNARAIVAEAARRAEIRINRMQAVHWGPNRYDDTEANIVQKHDASWYESRQTEEQWLGEVQ